MSIAADTAAVAEDGALASLAGYGRYRRAAARLDDAGSQVR